MKLVKKLEANRTKCWHEVRYFGSNQLRLHQRASRNIWRIAFWIPLSVVMNL